jgi:hypothetical protein
MHVNTEGCTENVNDIFYATNGISTIVNCFKFIAVLESIFLFIETKVIAMI